MNNRRNRRAFTLTELLVVIVIIAILASMVLLALYGAMEGAKRKRTQTEVMRLNDMVMEKWESYRTRAVRLNLPASSRRNALNLAAARLTAIRDLQRMELPDRISDLSDFPVAIPFAATTPPTPTLRLTAPSVWHAYRRRAGFGRGSTTPPPSWTTAHQGAECLYLIVSLTRDGDTSGLDFFKESEIGDTDSDGMPEILDGWGRPIEFLRWAPGYSISTGNDGMWGAAASANINLRGQAGSDDELVSDLQIPNGTLSPDPFDPLKVDDDLRSALGQPGRQSFALVPLVYSAGPDTKYDVITSGVGALHYAATPVPVDPFYVIPPVGTGPEKQVGQPWDTANDGELNSIDNVTNHLIVE